MNKPLQLPEGTTVTVVCDDRERKRRRMLIDVLFRAGVNTVFVWNSPHSGYSLAPGEPDRPKKPIVWTDIKESPCVILFVHWSDRIYMPEELRQATVFSFELFGKPDVEGGWHPIFRETGESKNRFEVSLSDVIGMVQFALGLGPLPSCCRHNYLQYLPALAVLFQGYIVVQETQGSLAPGTLGFDAARSGICTVDRRADVESVSWWKAVLFPKTEFARFALQVEAEWNAFPNLADFMNTAFMKRLKNASPILPPEIVVQAYDLLTRRLRGETFGDFRGGGDK